jgi:hypothetical protein
MSDSPPLRAERLPRQWRPMMPARIVRYPGRRALAVFVCRAREGGWLVADARAHRCPLAGAKSRSPNS